MFKSFALAILPAIAFARGEGDGTSQANAAEVTLLDDPVIGVVKLYTYNAWNADSETDEFHGDLEIQPYGAVDAPGSLQEVVTSWVNYGFCIQQTSGNDDLWDCMQVKADIIVDELNNDPLETVSQTFDVFDSTIAKSTWDSVSTAGGVVNMGNAIVYDADQTAEVDTSFVRIGSKSYKTSCVNTVSSYVKCEAINVHWYRNWTTTEADSDRQIADSDADATTPCWGWAQINSNNNGSSATPQRTVWTDGTQDCQIAFPKYIEARNEANAPEPEPETEDDEDDTVDDTTDDDTTDDGASMLTSAAAVAATVYALTF